MPIVSFWISLILVPLFTLSNSASGAEISGILLERGTRKPIRDSALFWVRGDGIGSEKRIRTLTDSEGRFSFQTTDILPPNAPAIEKLIVNLPQYERLDWILDFNEMKELKLYIEPQTGAVLETTIRAQKKRNSPSQRTLSQKDFLAAPGANGDPVRALQNLPGVNRIQGLGAQVVIQGAGPNDTSYLIDQHAVPIVFHFGGLSSVVSPFAVEDVDLMAAGYGAQFGRANGGLVNLTVRNARRDRMHGLAFIDLLNAGAQVEGQFGRKGGWILSGRQSYIGSVLRAVLKNNKDFDLTVAPTYRDLTLGIDYAVTEKDQIKFTSVYSRDELSFLFKQPLKADPALRGNFDNRTEFFRFIPQWTHEHSAIAKTRLSIGAGKDKIKVNAGENLFNLDVTALTVRSEYEQTLSPFWTQRIGMDHRFSWATVDLALPSFSNSGGITTPLSSGTRRLGRIETENHSLGAYLSADVKPQVESQWTLLPQLRLDRYVETDEIVPQPRVGARYQVNSFYTLRGATGLYSQPAQPQESDRYFGNPNIRAPRSLHATVGAEFDARRGGTVGLSGESDLFGRSFDRLVLPSSAFVWRDGALVSENYNNNGRGYAFGLQNELKWTDSDWSARLIYTLSRSQRYQPGNGWASAAFDQTHLLGLVGSKQMGKWTIAGRFRYATGNPVTPVSSGVFDSDSDVYVPIRGRLYSERLPAFYQLDLRFDRRWTFDTWILSVYLDIQNITNRRNPEGRVYSFDYTEKDTISGLPILPLIGVKGEF